MQILPAIAVDVICILVFAILGRSSHQEATDLLGVAHTAWPFLAGCTLGTVLGRTWRHPFAVKSGVTVWLGTVAGGMGLRLLTGAGVQLSFIIVASCVLALLLIGWRVIFGLIQHARANSSRSATASESAAADSDASAASVSPHEAKNEKR
jgi:predicted lipid-binding transport protein (Tim44 family)